MKDNKKVFAVAFGDYLLREYEMSQNPDGTACWLKYNEDGTSNKIDTIEVYNHFLALKDGNTYIADYPDLLFNAIFNTFGVTRKQIESSSRGRTIVPYRQMICYFLNPKTCRHYTATLEQIGDLIGFRHHTTVMYAIKNTQDLLDAEDDLVTHIYIKLKQLL